MTRRGSRTLRSRGHMHKSPLKRRANPFLGRYGKVRIQAATPHWPAELRHQRVTNRGSLVFLGPKKKRWGCAKNASGVIPTNFRGPLFSLPRFFLCVFTTTAFLCRRRGALSPCSSPPPTDRLHSSSTSSPFSPCSCALPNGAHSVSAERTCDEATSVSQRICPTRHRQRRSALAALS